jgi:hypothetical protein
MGEGGLPVLRLHGPSGLDLGPNNCSRGVAVERQRHSRSARGVQAGLIMPHNAMAGDVEPVVPWVTDGRPLAGDVRCPSAGAVKTPSRLQPAVGSFGSERPSMQRPFTAVVKSALKRTPTPRTVRPRSPTGRVRYMPMLMAPETIQLPRGHVLLRLTMLHTREGHRSRCADETRASREVPFNATDPSPACLSPDSSRRPARHPRSGRRWTGTGVAI